jgi:nucleoid-associated protein YgaU
LIGDNGSWRAVLSDVDEGVSTLRVDEINTEGNVQARVESLFQRAAVKDLLVGGVTSTDTGRVVVQPGHTLWELAENTYGDGVKYVKIFHANRNAIRDADLIYPGQIFELPE